MPKVKPDQLREISADFAPVPGVWLSEQELRELSALLRSPVQSKDDLFLACQNLATISVEGAEITLEPGLLKRLKTRCINQAFPAFVKKTVVDQLHHFVGW